MDHLFVFDIVGWDLGVVSDGFAGIGVISIGIPDVLAYPVVFGAFEARGRVQGGAL